MNRLKSLMLLVMVAVLSITLVGCGCSKKETIYTVTFDSNGGTKVEKQEVKENEKVEKPSNPTRKGYKFKGWYLDGKKYDFDTEVTEDIKLKAKWSKVAGDDEDEDYADESTTVTTTPTTNNSGNTGYGYNQNTPAKPTVTKKVATANVDMPSKTSVAAPIEFTVNVNANDDNGRKAIEFLYISDISAVEKIEVKENGTWKVLDLTPDIYGIVGELNISNMSRTYRVTFNTAGQYEIGYALMDYNTGDDIAESLKTVTVEYNKPDIKLTLPTQFFVGEDIELAIESVKTDELTGTNVIGQGTITTTVVDGVKSIAYYNNSTSSYQDLSSKTDFNFNSVAIESVNEKFKFVFAKEGKYTLNIKLVDANDNTTVIVETTKTITVVEKQAPDVIVSTPDKTTTKVPTELYVYTWSANDYAGTNVKGIGTITSTTAPTGVSKIEKVDGQGNVTDTGKTDSFEISETKVEDIDSQYKVTFDQAGEYTINVKIVDATDDTIIIAETSETIIVE